MRRAGERERIAQNVEEYRAKIDRGEFLFES
jgi:hypothetical protein